MKSDPYDVVGAMTLSRATLRKMHQNLWWAVGYNVVAFPLAAGVFYPVLLGPEIAALAMSGSSALVALNALLLKRTRLDGMRPPASPTGEGGSFGGEPDAAASADDGEGELPRRAREGRSAMSISAIRPAAGSIP
jgi:Cu2+-exporting ATPase